MKWTTLLLIAFLGAAANAADPGEELFEKKIRPIFAEHCAKCHGEKKQSAGLRLDSVEGIRKGADDGPVLVAGKAKESRLLKSVRHEGDYAMPPNKKLPAESIAALTQWIESGAAMPANAIDSGKADPRKHWAFQPVKPLAGNHSIDEFIEAKLKEKGLSLAPSADRRTLIIRVSIDLIGLPPSFDEIAAFERDTSPNAFEKVVDRLLASPRYGERWARHWLDVARYADTKGYVFTEDRNFPYAYTYRDYVIDAFNDDKPYNQFVIEQIAADKLKLGSDNRALAAMGYLTLGRRFNNNIHDIIDDRIEVVTRGFLGLSVGCARCHDHKFDPIPIGDYYSLYGIFAGSKEPQELPLITGQPRTPEVEAFEKEVARLDALAAAKLKEITEQALMRFRTAASVAEYLMAWKELRGKPAQAVTQMIKDRGLNNIILNHWRQRLDRAKAERDPILGLFTSFADLQDAEFAAKMPSLKERLLREGKLNPVLHDSLRDAMPSNAADIAAITGECLAAATKETGRNPAEAALHEMLCGPTSPTAVKGEEADAVTPVTLKNSYRKLRNAAQNYRATSPHAPGRAMILQDTERQPEQVVFLRGNPGNRGPKVPRQFLEVLAPERKPFIDGSGRLELAQAIADPANPLTARVMVNRVWAWHFGQGLVRTPSDFGVRSDPPSHPELLDWLADQFVKDNWSIKKLHRKIVLSKAYCQSNTMTDQAMAADPENVLLSRSPRRRLEFEALRDRMLHASGLLDLNRIGGRSDDIFHQPFSGRRSVYMHIERQNLPATLRAFDLANPDQHSPGRYRTTVPQQALFLMNSPFAAETARKAAARPEVMAAANEAEKVNALYRLVLGRNPSDAEATQARDFIRNAATSESGLKPWEQLAQALMMSNEFAFAD